MLTEDWERRTEKHRPWEKCTQCIKIGPMKRVEPISLRKVHDSGSSSDSGACVQVEGVLEFIPKIFNDPKNTSSDKENNPMNDSQTMLMLNGLNITDGTVPEGLPERPPNFVGPYCPMCVLKWPRCFCISESDWEDTMTKQMPRTSSPIPHDSDKNLEKLETETDEDLDEIDYRARLANDRRKPKHILRHRPTLSRSHPQIGSKMTAPHLRLIQSIQPWLLPCSKPSSQVQ